MCSPTLVGCIRLDDHFQASGSSGLEISTRISSSLHPWFDIEFACPGYQWLVQWCHRIYHLLKGSVVQGGLIVAVTFPTNLARSLTDTSCWCKRARVFCCIFLSFSTGSARWRDVEFTWNPFPVWELVRISSDRPLVPGLWISGTLRNELGQIPSDWCNKSMLSRYIIRQIPTCLRSLTTGFIIFVNTLGADVSPKGRHTNW